MSHARTTSELVSQHQNAEGDTSLHWRARFHRDIVAHLEVQIDMFWVITFKWAWCSDDGIVQISDA